MKTQEVFLALWKMDWIKIRDQIPKLKFHGGLEKAVKELFKKNKLYSMQHWK